MFWNSPSGIITLEKVVIKLINCEEKILKKDEKELQIIKKVKKLYILYYIFNFYNRSK